METILKFLKEQILPSSWRGYVNVFVFVVLVVALAKTCYKEHKLNVLIKESSSLKPAPNTPATDKAEEISRLINSLGKEETTYRVAEPIIKNMVSYAKVDSFAKLLDIERKNIKGYTEINGSLSKENLTLKRSLGTLSDELGALVSDTSWTYTDPWLAIQARKQDSNFVINKIWADASVSKVDHSHKKFWVFGRNETRATVYFNSPYVKVNGLNTLRIKEPSPFVDLEVKVGAHYLQDKQQLLMGPSVRLGLGRVGVTGGYYINPAGKIGNSFWYGVDWKLY